MDKPNTAIIYICPGVSMNIGGRSIQLQIDACLGSIKNADLRLLATFEEKKFEPDVTKRPVLQDLLQYCRGMQEKIGYLYVYRLDRLGWGKDKREAIISELEDYGVTVRDASGWLEWI